MQTFKEKITFILTALGYIIFHLALSADPGGGYSVDVPGTVTALLNTLPYEIGFTYLVIVFIRRTTGGKRPPWDRALRIFFTIGIIFGLIYALFIRGIIEQQRHEGKQEVSVSRSVLHDTRTVTLHWA